MSMLRLCSLLPPFPFPLPGVDREAVIENSSYWRECTRFLTVPALQELAGLCVWWAEGWVLCVHRLLTRNRRPLFLAGEGRAPCWLCGKRGPFFQVFCVSCVTCEVKMGRCLSTVFLSHKGINPSKSLPFVTCLKHKTHGHKSQGDQKYTFHS